MMEGNLSRQLAAQLKFKPTRLQREGQRSEKPRLFMRKIVQGFIRPAAEPPRLPAV